MARLKPLWLSLGEVAEQLSGAGSLAVACDFDGTLTPIVAHPDDAVLGARARRAVERLVRLPRTSVAVLSGRGLEDLRRRLAVEGVHLAGSSGLETLDSAGRHARHVPPGGELPAGLLPAMEEWIRRFPGAWLEDKGEAFALHYRAVPKGQQEAFGAGVRRRIGRWRGQVRLVHGKKVFEVLPQVAWDKAAALEHWLAGLADPLSFFFGDDAIDESVHESVRRHGGVAVAVGRIVTRAEYGLPDTDHLVWFLEWLAREWQEARGGEYRRADG